MNPIIASTGAFTEIVEAKRPSKPNDDERCPACNRPLDWDDTYYGGCCSTDCYQYMIMEFCS